MTPPELIAALDVPGLAEEEEALRRLKGATRWVKVGLQLYTAAGPRAVAAAREAGFSVFLDLKLHDIPQTVALAVAEAAKLGASSLSVHLSGGSAMLRAAAAVPSRPKLWGVSVLTSMADADLSEAFPGASVSASVPRLAKLGLSAGVDGIICSSADAETVKKAVGGGVPLITPGIRPAGADVGDQKRVVDVAQAFKNGADYIVVGRP
ncbi:MAG TPA: orotidine-5'-phosphate decarboxylase, partial [Elusimicrobiota bacterium]|nr:orotidine-5'-phosphate decarboxylase [Elusimicrobiota bacterium]